MKNHQYRYGFMLKGNCQTGILDHSQNKEH